MTVKHGGNVWQGEGPDAWLDFSANLNPDGPPDWVREAMVQGLSRARIYPDPAMTAARRGVAMHLGVPENCVTVTAGGIGAVALAAKCPGGHVVAQPTFQEYGRLCIAHRSIFREELRAHRFAQGECLWLCNPNNPTGDALGRDAVLDLLARAEHAGARLIVDEAFIEYCPGHSVAHQVADHPALIVLGAFTKVLAIPGVRLGYMIAHPQVTRALAADLPPWRLNCVADAVAAALPGHAADFECIRRLNQRRRTAFAADLRALGARVYPSDASFLLCDFGRDMRPVIDAIRRRHILVRPCGMFPGLTHGHVRLCVRTESENARLVEALRGTLRGTLSP